MKNSSRKLSIKIWALCALATSFVACGEDEAEVQSKGAVCFAAPVDEWSCGRSHTRASADDFNTGESLPAAQPEVIGVWGYSAFGWMQTQGTPAVDMVNSAFTYEPEGDKLYHCGEWNQSTATPSDDAFPWSEMDYSFYAYAPYQATGAAFNSTTSTFSLTLPAVTDVDYVVAKQLKSHNPTKEGVIVKFTDEDFSFKHAYACIRLAFALDSRYAKLRYIDVRSVAVEVAGSTGSGTYTYNARTATSTWTAADAADDAPFTLGPQDGEAWLLGDRSALEGMHASGVYHAYNCFYLREQPASNASVSLSVTYDVYDMDGVLTRKGAVAESTIAWGNTVNTQNAAGVRYLRAGYYYNLLINIVPNYLYVMSDNDDGDADATIVVDKALAASCERERVQCASVSSSNSLK